MKCLITLLTALYAATTLAQLNSTVGRATTVASKTAIKTCNVLSYGGAADNKTDIGPPLLQAWTACKSGGLVLIPEGNYVMATWVLLQKGKGVAIQLDGIISRTGTAGGNMIMVKDSSDIEMFSSTGKGGMQGYGYEIHKTGSITGCRLLRFVKTTSFSIHDISLVDSPAFHLFLDTCHNGEIYNLLIRGGDHGGLDGIDIIGTNIHVHDVMVTNKDECVTVKSPSSNLLIEQIYCNWSGGSAIGSLSTGTAIEKVVYRKVYTVSANQMMMIKSRGGSGYVRDIVFEEFIGHKNAYSLNIDQDWDSQTEGEGSGVQLSNINITNWRGTCANGKQRGPIQVKCDADVPCMDIDISDFAMWTEAGSAMSYICENAYGSGACLKTGSGGAYSVTQSVGSAPAGYEAEVLGDDVVSSFGFDRVIPMPEWPERFFPGTVPLKTLAAAS